MMPQSRRLQADFALNDRLRTVSNPNWTAHNLLEHNAMQQKFTRREVLNSASGMVAATALGGLIDNRAVASEEAPGHVQDRLTPSRAFASIDQMLRRAADGKTVAGIVAFGATEKGVV